MNKVVVVLLVLLSVSIKAWAVDDGAQFSEMKPVIVTATRIANYHYELTGDITVIDSDTIEAMGARTVHEVLRQYAGIYVYDLSTAKSAVIDMRGFGQTANSNVLFLVNDRKLNSVDLAGPDLIQIPVDAIERIEIIRGAGSTLYGDNAVGGVINLITKKGEGDFQFDAMVEYGSYDRFKTSGQVSGQVNDLTYYAYSSYDDDKGYRDQSDVLSKNFNTRFTYIWNDRIGLDVEVGGHKDETELPGGLDEVELISLGRRGAADDNFSETEDVFVRLGLDVELGDDAGEWGTIVVDWTHKDREVFDSFFTTFNSDRDIDQDGILAKYVFDETLFEKDVNFVVGIDYYDTTNDIIGSGTNTDDITISKEEFGVYSFLELEILDNFYINAGGRYQEADYTFDDRGNNLLTSESPDDWVYVFGLKYVYAPGSNIFFNTQETFRFLATDEWYSTFSGLNTMLDQQKGEQIEGGIRHQIAEAVDASVTGYIIELEDEIYFNPSTFTNDNYDRTQRKGIEAALNIDFLKIVDLNNVQRLDFILGFSDQTAEFDGGVDDGRLLPQVPDQQWSHQIILQIWENFVFTFQGRWIGDRIIGNDFDNSKPKASSYYVADARFTFKQDNCEIFIEVNNVFDEIYNTYEIEKTSFFFPNVTRDVYPAEERNMNAGVKFRF